MNADNKQRASTALEHTCHWPGCDKHVPPAMWGCKQHWFALPKQLRDKIWATYRPGQEITKTPSAAYLQAAAEVQVWIASHHSIQSNRKSKRKVEFAFDEPRLETRELLNTELANFSRVVLRNPKTGTEREVLIPKIDSLDRDR